MQDQLWPFIIPLPFEVKVHTVPHFKAPINAKVEPGPLKWGGTFMYENSIVNLGQLVHKTGFVQTGVVGTVGIK